MLPILRSKGLRDPRGESRGEGKGGSGCEGRKGLGRMSSGGARAREAPWKRGESGLGAPIGSREGAGNAMLHKHYHDCSGIENICLLAIKKKNCIGKAGVHLTTL